MLSGTYDSDGRESGLTARLDPAIGETSTGIGMLMAELVRRSLRSGVSQIDQSLNEFAIERVELAVNRKMPEVTEVAEETSRKISETAVKEITEKTEKRTQELSQSLDAAVGRLGGKAEETDRNLQELRAKAKQSWKLVMAEIDTLKEQNTHLRHQLEQAQSNVVELNGEIISLRQKLDHQQRESANRVSLIQSALARLDELERPKGLSALFQRMTGRNKKRSDAPALELHSEEPELPGIELDDDESRA